MDFRDWTMWHWMCILPFFASNAHFVCRSWLMLRWENVGLRWRIDMYINQRRTALWRYVRLSLTRYIIWEMKWPDRFLMTNILEFWELCSLKFSALWHRVDKKRLNEAGLTQPSACHSDKFMILRFKLFNKQATGSYRYIVNPLGTSVCN